jgi:hypothetical protein
MKTHQNPLFDKANDNDAHADLSRLQCPTVLLDQRKRSARREVRDARRSNTAREAIDGFGQECSIHALTKGQFSLLDVLDAIVATTGPVEVNISTWTAARLDIHVLSEWLKVGRVHGVRWLVDMTLHRRDPLITQQIRDLFGKNSMRVAMNHAKITLLTNDEWSVVVQSSMNLNMNPRFEQIQIAHDPELCQFYMDFFNEVWAKQSISQYKEPWRKTNRHFLNDL